MGDEIFRGDGIESRIGGLRLHRIQSVSESIGLGDEDAVELGNRNIVETTYDVPDVSVSLEANEDATTRLLSLACNLSFGCKVSASGAGFNVNAGHWHSQGAYWELEQGLTGLAISPASSTSRIDVVSLKKTDTDPKYTLTGGVEAASPSAPSTPANEIKIAEITVDTAGILSITDSRSAAFTTITQNSFDGAVVDFSTLIQSPGTFNQTTEEAEILAAEFIGNLYPVRWSGSYDVTGFARESVEFSSDRHTLLNGTAKHLVHEKFVSGGGTTVSLSQAPVALTTFTSATRYAVLLRVNGTICTEVTSAPSSASEFSISGTTVTFGSALSSGDVVSIYYGCVLPAGQLFRARNTEYKGATRRAEVVPCLWDGSSATALLRVQSVSLEVPIERSQNLQLGFLEAFSRSMQFPVKGSGRISVLHSDVNIFYQLIAKTPANENSMRLADYQRDRNATTCGAKVLIYDNADHSNLLKSILVPEIMITSPTPISKSVGSDAVSEFGFSFDQFTMKNEYY